MTRTTNIMMEISNLRMGMIINMMGAVLMEVLKVVVAEKVEVLKVAVAEKVEVVAAGEVTNKVDHEEVVDHVVVEDQEGVAVDDVEDTNHVVEAAGDRADGTKGGGIMPKITMGVLDCLLWICYLRWEYILISIVMDLILKRKLFFLKCCFGPISLCGLPI